MLRLSAAGSLVRVSLPDPWPTTEDDAFAVQGSLRPRLRLPAVDAPLDPDVTWPRFVAGLDVAYDAEHELAAGAVAVFDTVTRTLVDTATALTPVEFPYVPGLLAFREIPPLAAALRLLEHDPDLLFCDGFGLAHPRRFGLACHLGVLTGLPSIGVAKTPYVGTHGALGDARGSVADLVDNSRVVGRALRTRHGVRPLYVSVGHRIDLDTACRHVLSWAPHFRQPEPIRAADAACREALRVALGVGAVLAPSAVYGGSSGVSGGPSAVPGDRSEPLDTLVREPGRE
jgi:deoxyribonuclease V